MRVRLEFSAWMEGGGFCNWTRELIHQTHIQTMCIPLNSYLNSRNKLAGAAQLNSFRKTFSFLIVCIFHLLSAIILSFSY